MNSPFPVLTLHGDAQARGQAHGEVCRDMIARHIDLWRETTAAQMGMPWREIADRLLLGTGFAAAAQKWTPELWVELQGIAAGADQNFVDVLLLNLTDEQWWITNQKHAEACTSFAYRDEAGCVWSGQNLDISAWMDGLQVVLRYPLPKGGSAMVATLAGTLGMSGINSHGLSICCNTLLQLPPTRQGLPCLFVIRGVLERPSLGDAENFLREIRHASGLHYLIADPHAWCGFECDAAGVRRVPGGTNWYGHTNHPKEVPELGSAISRSRLSAIEAALATGRAKAALSEVPLRRDGKSPEDPIGFTIFSGIWCNRPGVNPRFCAGPPTAAGYREIEMRIG
jgi:isopenicillin-N N-acyltransferase-like protein